MTRRRSTARRTPARGGQQGYEPPVTRMRRDERLLELALERWSQRPGRREDTDPGPGPDPSAPPIAARTGRAPHPRLQAARNYEPACGLQYRNRGGARTHNPAPSRHGLPAVPFADRSGLWSNRGNRHEPRGSLALDGRNGPSSGIGEARDVVTRAIVPPATRCRPHGTGPHPPRQLACGTVRTPELRASEVPREGVPES